jgi:hypothetical protein
MTLLRVDVDDGAAADLSFEDRRDDGGHIGEADDLRRADEIAQFQVAGESRPCLDANVLRGIDGVDAGEGHIAQDEGQQSSLSLITAGAASRARALGFALLTC